MATRPWPAPKPPEIPDLPLFAGVLEMALSTDKPTYRHHEQVKLTVTLTNQTDKDLTFPRPPDNPFGLGMSYPRGGSSIDEFWKRYRKDFPHQKTS